VGQVDKSTGFRNDPVVGQPGIDQERRERSRIAALLGHGELFLDGSVAFALAGSGVILLAGVLFDYASRLGQVPLVPLSLELLSGLLLVFIFTELISTLRVIIARRRVEVEPFLIVGIVAAIRRLIVVGAEAENVIGTDKFRDVMVEIGVLTGSALVLGLTILIMRYAREGRDEPPTAPAKD
jgi:uncharacterized membrane protein (DUF373 family)